jgi:hypothetical protein
MVINMSNNIKENLVVIEEYRKEIEAIIRASTNNEKILDKLANMKEVIGTVHLQIKVNLSKLRDKIDEQVGY